jgi:hypothetical protein
MTLFASCLVKFATLSCFANGSLSILFSPACVQRSSCNTVETESNRVSSNALRTVFRSAGLKAPSGPVSSEAVVNLAIRSLLAWRLAQILGQIHHQPPLLAACPMLFENFIPEDTALLLELGPPGAVLADFDIIIASSDGSDDETVIARVCLRLLRDEPGFSGLLLLLL